MVALVNEVGNDLVSRHKWRRLTYETTVSTSATTIYALPADLYEIVNNTVWSRTDRQEAFGPATEQTWQMQKATSAVSTLVPEWRLNYSQGVPRLELLAAPGTATVTEVWVLEYRSTNWIVNTTSSATAALWTLDAERSNLDDHLFYTELKWRWLKSKGADYSIDFANAAVQRDVEICRDKGGAQILDMAGARRVSVISSVGL